MEERQRHDIMMAGQAETGGASELVWASCICATLTLYQSG